MRPSVVSAAASILLLVAFSASQGLLRASAFTFQNGVYTLYPGQNIFSGINDTGQIVGYIDTHSQGFLFDNGVFTAVTGPGTNPIGINNGSQILAVSNNLNGGVLVTSGISTPLPDEPAAASSSTFYKGLNDNGAFVGLFCPPPSCNLTGDGYSFVYANGVFITISVPGSPATTRVSGINNNGTISGNYNDVTGRHGFVYANGVFTTVDVPGGINPFITSISNTGYLAGIVGNSSFLDINGVFTAINVPGALFTEALGVNSSGNVVGWYIEGAVVPEPGSLMLVTFGLAGVTAVRVRRSTDRKTKHHQKS